MILLTRDMDTAEVNEMMTSAKKEYVLSRHSRAISQMIHASGYKKDKWKTYVGEDSKHRKEIIKDTEEEVYEALFEYYS